MEISSPILNNIKIKLSVCLIIVLLTTACSQQAIQLTAPSAVEFGITIEAPTPISGVTEIPVTGFLSPVPGLVVKTSVNCYCQGNGVIRAIISITPINGTPPYIIPGFEFVDFQIFSGNWGDVYHITLMSSDYPPLIYAGEFTLACIPKPSCGNNNNNNNGNSSSGSSSSNSSSSSSSGSNSSSSSSSSSNSSSSSSSSSSSPSSSSSSSNSSSSNPSSSSSDSSSSSSSSSSFEHGIPDCPPPGQGGNEPPGICKKP